jgi:lipoxygenase
MSKEEDEVKYESSFEIPEDFGEVGAILVENGHQKEMFFKDIILNGFPYGPLHISCNSWVHSKNDNPQKRVFFANKVSLARISFNYTYIHTYIYNIYIYILMHA